MNEPHLLTALAAVTMPSGPTRTQTRPGPRPIAAAAIVARFEQVRLTFSFRTLVANPGPPMRRWLNPLLAESQHLAGYELDQLLIRLGIHPSRHWLRHAAADALVRGTTALKPPSLAALADRHRLLAIDESALRSSYGPIGSVSAATLALINAAIAWRIAFRKLTGGADQVERRARGLADLIEAVRRSGNAALIAAVDPSVH